MNESYLTALQTLIQYLDKANTKGAFNLNESGEIVKAILLVKSEINGQLPKEDAEKGGTPETAKTKNNNKTTK